MKIALDFGHGGKDPGAVDGKGDDTVYPDKYYTEESKLVRHIGLKLAYKLDEIYEVYLTRPNEEYVSLEDRCVLSNEEDVDIFLSLHANASANKNANGIEVLYYPDSKNGIKLSSKVQDRLIKATRATDRGIKPRDDIFVLEETVMPSVLIELGFITNPQEEKQLWNKSYQNNLINAIFEGVKEYERI